MCTIFGFPARMWCMRTYHSLSPGCCRHCGLQTARTGPRSAMREAPIGANDSMFVAIHLSKERFFDADCQLREGATLRGHCGCFRRICALSLREVFYHTLLKDVWRCRWKWRRRRWRQGRCGVDGTVTSPPNGRVSAVGRRRQTSGSGLPWRGSCAIRSILGRSNPTKLAKFPDRKHRVPHAGADCAR